MDHEGVHNSAILLLSVGEEEAAEVFKYLTPKEVQKLSQAMAGLENVTRDRVDNVLQAFHIEAAARTTVGGGDYVRNVLIKALGDDRASGLIDRILRGTDTTGIESLRWMDAVSIAELIKNEHPQIIATILVHLDRDQASDVLGNFTERTRNDVMLRIATLDRVQPIALEELNSMLTKLLSGSQNLKKSVMGGVDAAAEILNFMGTTNEGSVVKNMTDYDPELAQKVMDKMFVFENILDIDDRGIQAFLTEVSSDNLVIALKGASEALQEKIFKNMSQRAAETLREDLESRGPVRLSDVETQQKEVLKVVRKMAEEGRISLGGKGEEYV